MILLALGCVPAIAAPALQDDRGRHFEVSTPARRVVALAPHLAELMFDIGAGTALVASVRGADWPPAVAALPRVGDAAGIDVERVLALRPDLVLAWGSGNRPADIARLQALGLRVFVNEPRTLSDVARTLRRLGRLTGSTHAGEASARRYEARLAQSRRDARDAAAVFVQIWDRPLMTVNGAHLVSQALRHCGSRNVFASLPALAGSVSREEVLAAAPDTLLVLAPPGRASEWISAWARFAHLRRRTIALDPDLLTRATPRLLQGVEALCGALAGSRTDPAHRPSASEAGAAPAAALPQDRPARPRRRAVRAVLTRALLRLPGPCATGRRCRLRAG